MSGADRPLIVVVGSGGVGKTTIAAALGLTSARAGRDTLVMTFDPSMRLKDTLGVGDSARDRAVRVATDTPGRLDAALLDAPSTFDRLVRRYAPDDASCERILHNRFYQYLTGNLAGILEYMAVERMYEIAAEDRYRRVVLDTPPTRQALDFLQAPQRIVAFLDSRALSIGVKPWFDENGQLEAARRLPGLGRRLSSFLDRVVGLGLLREMSEFFRAFAPLYEGFRERALRVQGLLRSPDTRFVLVSGPGAECIPDTMFFARQLEQVGYELGPVVVNRVHPELPADIVGSPVDPAEGRALHLLHWLGDRDRRGLVEIRSLLPGRTVLAVPLRPEAPTGLRALEQIGESILGE